MKVELGPVTRLEGHLNVKTTVENNQIFDAKVEGEMFRGFERILQGRDPLDAQQITQRICGICHSHMAFRNHLYDYSKCSPGDGEFYAPSEHLQRTQLKTNLSVVE